MLIRCLNERGLAEFESFLSGLSRGGGASDCSHLLDSPDHSEPLVLGDVEISARHFSNRYDFARYLDGCFEQSGIWHDVDVAGMWEWLAVFYFDELRPSGRSTGVDPRRFVVDSSAGRRLHRHLLRDPYMLYRRYKHSDGGELDLLLCDELWRYGDVVEDLSARGRLRNSAGVLRVARSLYFDAEVGRPKVGTRNGLGGHRHFSRLLRNLPPEFDLSTMSAESVIALLPPEFERWYSRDEDSQLLFDVEPFGGAVSQLDDQFPDALDLAEILQDADDRGVAPSKRRVRSDLFRAGVLGAYENRCAISQLGLVHTELDTEINYEVQAAHVIPVASGGRDVVPNGLALSRSLHWAFDLGMVWVDAEMRVGVASEVQNDRRNEWLREFEGRRLWIPDDVRLQPSAEALEWHERHVAIR